MPLVSTRFRRIALAVLAVAAVLTVGLLGGAAGANHGSNGGPGSSKQIPNLGLVKNQIKAYYGDFVDADGSHQASPDSAYAKEVKRVEADAVAKLKHARHHGHGTPALVFDVDDTSLLTYNYEANNDFGYNATVNAQYVLGEKFPVVFGMDRLISISRQAGYKIFFITGRPQSQHAATIGNLEKAGIGDPTPISATEDGLFTKPNSGDPFPSYINCNADGTPACSTIEYKSQTRAHLQSEGYDIRGNFGDQYSDLSGGHADQSFKMPNPMYYLP